MGGGKIKDATATPQDVMTGKVFYNNEGRQVGSKSETIKGLKVLNLSIPKQVYRGTSEEINNIYKCLTYDGNNNINPEMIEYPKKFFGLKIQSFNFDNILGFELDGMMLLIDNPRFGKRIVFKHTAQGAKINGNSGINDLCIIFNDNCIYLGCPNNGYTVSFQSIEPDYAQNLKVYYI